MFRSISSGLSAEQKVSVLKGVIALQTLFYSLALFDTIQQFKKLDKDRRRLYQMFEILQQHADFDDPILRAKIEEFMLFEDIGDFNGL